MSEALPLHGTKENAPPAGSSMYANYPNNDDMEAFEQQHLTLKKRSQIPRGQIPRGQIPGGQVPRVQLPRGQIPRGQIPRGQISRAQIPRAQTLRGQIPRGQIPPWTKNITAVR